MFLICSLSFPKTVYLLLANLKNIIIFFSGYICYKCSQALPLFKWWRFLYRVYLVVYDAIASVSSDWWMIAFLAFIRLISLFDRISEKTFVFSLLICNISYRRKLQWEASLVKKWDTRPKNPVVNWILQRRKVRPSCQNGWQKGMKTVESKWCKRIWKTVIGLWIEWGDMICLNNLSLDLRRQKHRFSEASTYPSDERYTVIIPN